MKQYRHVLFVAHADAVKSRPPPDDWDNPISDKGWSQIEQIRGDWLSGYLRQPLAAVASPALRTQQTINPHREIEVKIVSEIYPSKEFIAMMRAVKKGPLSDFMAQPGGEDLVRQTGQSIIAGTSRELSGPRKEEELLLVGCHTVAGVAAAWVLSEERGIKARWLLDLRLGNAEGLLVTQTEVIYHSFG